MVQQLKLGGYKVIFNFKPLLKAVFDVNCLFLDTYSSNKSTKRTLDSHVTNIKKAKTDKEDI